MHTARKKEKVKWRVATLNVNSIAQKAESVRKLCLDNNIDVCALQETRAFPEPDPFLDSEYSVAKMCPPQMERGTLGIAMLIKKPLLWEVLPYSTYNDLWVLVSNKTTSVIFVCVYVPCCDNLMALRVKNGILSKLSKRSNQAPVILMGDFNQPPTNVTTWFHQRKVNLLWVPHKGDAITHKGSSQSKGSTLDYILVPEKGVHYEQAIVHMGKRETLSDHFFVCASLWLKKESEPAPERPRVNREKVLEDFSAVTDDPRFHPSTCANTSVEQFTEDLLDAITEEGFLLKKRELFKRKTCVFNHREATLLAKRRTILQQRRQGGERTERDQTVLKKCRQLLRRVTHNHRFSFARQLVRTSKRNPAAFWRHIDQRIAGSHRKPLIIRDPSTDQIVTQPRQVVGVWKRHYTNVVSDASGRSKNREYWETIPLTPNPNSKLKDSKAWDREITEFEVENVVMAMGNGKSTGDDCIPVEVYKKLLRNRNKTLTCHINQLFDGHIPESFMTSQVISLHKKGDPMDVDNYRGISLMNVILKIACAVVANRITHEVETDHLLTPAQAGFRPEMQCTGHVSALLETINRIQSNLTGTGRKWFHEGEHAWVCFVDFKKAYDSVPHEALLYKMRTMGIGGKVYAFIEKLYAHSAIVVNANGYTSEPIPLERGLRQGCPLSPILFSLFINDILPEFTEREPWEPPCPHFLFADDLCIVGRSAEELQGWMDKVTEWANTWGMTVGPAKCGVMVVPRIDAMLENPSPKKSKKERSSKARISEEERIALEKEINEREWMLQGNRIPVVKEYKYLGVVIRNDLNRSRMIEARILAATSVLNQIQYLLMNPSIPASLRVRILKVKWIPVLLYGVHVWGGVKEDDARVQRFVNRALSMILQGWSEKSVSTMTLLLELGLEPIHVTALIRRMDMFISGRYTSAMLCSLIDSRKAFSTTQQTFIKTTERVSGSFVTMMKDCDLGDEEVDRELEAMEYARLNNRSKNQEREFVWKYYKDGRVLDMAVYTWLKMLSEDRTLSLKEYIFQGCVRNHCYMDAWYEHPELGRGFQVMMRIRVGAWEPASRLKKNGCLLRHCPCCMRRGGETLRHYILECWTFREQREVMMRNLRERLNPVDDDEIGWYIRKALGMRQWERIVRPKDGKKTLEEAWNNYSVKEVVDAPSLQAKRSHKHKLVVSLQKWEDTNEEQIEDDEREKVTLAAVELARYLQDTNPVRMQLLKDLLVENNRIGVGGARGRARARGGRNGNSEP